MQEAMDESLRISERRSARNTNLQTYNSADGVVTIYAEQAKQGYHRKAQQNYMR